MIALLAGTTAWQWVASIGTSALITLAFIPEPEPDPYADLGIVCIGVVAVGLVVLLIMQVRRLVIVLRKQREV